MADKEQLWVVGDGMDLNDRQSAGSPEKAGKQRLLVIGNGMVLDDKDSYKAHLF